MNLTPALCHQTAFNGNCRCCGVKAAAAGTPFCSRRCSWAAECRCPHCGRGRAVTNAYCTSGCRNQGLQANWCPMCGVCQISVAGCCSNALCAGSTIFLCENRASKRGFKSIHELLPLGHPGWGAVAAAFSHSFSSGIGTRITTLIKLNQPTLVKKKYLSHRSLVETTMSALASPKYGHGGEGNEQKRFFPLNYYCGGSTELVNLESKCHNPLCDVCAVLSRGFNLQDMNRRAHFGTSTVAYGLSCCAANGYGRRALLVARVVIGTPDLVTLTEDDPCPEIQTPMNHDLIHSAIITNGDPSLDNTFVFRDDAVDPLYLVLVE